MICYISDMTSKNFTLEKNYNWKIWKSGQFFRLDGVESMRLEMTMSTKEDEDVFKNCIEEIIEEGFTVWSSHWIPFEIMPKK